MSESKQQQGGGLDVTVELVRHYAPIISPDGGRPDRLAAVVHDHFDALVREAKMRERRAFIESCEALDSWIVDNATDREKRAIAALRCRVFGLSLSVSSDPIVMAWGMRISTMAPKVSPGAIDEQALIEFNTCVLAMRLELLDAYAAARGKTSPKDEWLAARDGSGTTPNGL